MAYQNVGTPKFFIDHSLFYQASDVQYLGDDFVVISSDDATKLLQLNPSGGIEYSEYFSFLIPRKMPMNYIAFLGHNGCKMYAQWGIDENYTFAVYEVDDLRLNFTIHGADSEYWGFSILEFNDDESGEHLRVALGDPLVDIARIGAVSVGSTYTMPNAPNLSLTMSREYGGTKEFTTYNGSSMSNTMWGKPPMWGDLGAWELHDPNTTMQPQALARSGRRTWDLKFSYIDDGDLWGSNQSLSTYLEPGTTGLSTNDISAGSIPAIMNAGINPSIDGGQDSDGWYVADDEYVWSTSNGIFVTQDIDIADISTLFSEFALKIVGITGMGIMSLNIGLPDEDEFIGYLTTLEAGQYYIVEIVAGTADFTTELFHTGMAGGVHFNYNILTNPSFFSQVWHKTLGGTLPFIFQPDSSNNNPDQFSICRFVNNSLKATQTAFNVYDISVSIEEVW